LPVKGFRRVVGLLMAGGSLGLAGLVLAQGTGYELIGYRVGTGGLAVGQGGSYSLTAAAGRWEAGVVSGGAYTLSGGADWVPGVSSPNPPPVGPSPQRLFLPAISRR
jgi:hypothetical protein